MRIADKITLAAVAPAIVSLAAAYWFLRAAPDQPSRWVELSQHSNADTYYDERSVRSTDGWLSVSFLMNYTEPQTEPVAQTRSLIAQMRINCGERSYFFDDETYYSDKMGAGVVLKKSKDATAYVRVPDHLSPLLQRYCG